MKCVGTTLKAQLIHIDELTRSHHKDRAKLEEVKGELEVLQLEKNRLARKLRDSGDYLDKYEKLHQEFEEHKKSSFSQINELLLKYQNASAELEESKAKNLSQNNGSQEEKEELSKGKKTKPKAKNAKVTSPAAQPAVSQDNEELKKKWNLKLITAHKENSKLQETLEDYKKQKIELELENYQYRKEIIPLIADQYIDKDKPFDKTIEDKINKAVKKYKEEISVLQQAHKELQESHQELQSQVSGYQLEISLLQECQDSRHSAEDGKKMIEKLEKEITEIKLDKDTEISVLKQTHKELQESHQELQSQVSGYQLEISLLQECQDSRHLAENGKKMIEKLEKEITEIKLDKDTVVFENNELREKICGLEIKISRLQDQIREFTDTPDDELIDSIFKEMKAPNLLSPERMDPESRTWSDEVENDYCLSSTPEIGMPDFDGSLPALLPPILSPEKVGKTKTSKAIKSTKISRHCIKKHRAIPDILGTLRYLDKHRMFFTISNVPIKPVNKISRSSLTEIHENVNLVKPQKNMQRNSRCQLSCLVKECCDNSYFLLRSKDDESDLLGFYSVKDESKEKTLTVPAIEQQKDQSREDLLTTRREKRDNLRKSRLSMSANMIIRKLNESMLLKRKKQIRRRNRRRIVENGGSNEEQNVMTSNTDESYDVQNDEILRGENDDHLESEIRQQISDTESIPEPIPETQSVVYEMCDTNRDKPQDISKKAEAPAVVPDNKHAIKKSALLTLRQKIRKSSATPLTGSSKRNTDVTSEETTKYSSQPTMKRISHVISERFENSRTDSSDSAIVDSDLKTPTRLDRVLSPARRQSPRFLDFKQHSKSTVDEQESVGTKLDMTRGVFEKVVEDLPILEPKPPPRLDRVLSPARRQSPRFLDSKQHSKSTVDEQESVGTKLNMTRVVFEKVVKDPPVLEPKPFARIKIQPLQVEMPEVIPVEWTKTNGYFKVPSTTLYENMKASLERNSSMLSSNINNGATIEKLKTLATPSERLEPVEVVCDKECKERPQSLQQVKKETFSRLMMNNLHSPALADEETFNQPMVENPQSPPFSERGTLSQPTMENPQSPPISEKGTLNQPVVENPQSPPLSERGTLSQPVVENPQSPPLSERGTLSQPVMENPQSPPISEKGTFNQPVVENPQSPPLSEIRTLSQPMMENPQSPLISEKGTLNQPVVENPQSPSISEKGTFSEPRAIPLGKLSAKSEAFHREELALSCSKTIPPERTSPPKAVKTEKMGQKRKRQPCDLVSQIVKAMSASAAKPPQAKVRKFAVAAPPVEEEHQQCNLHDDSQSDGTPKLPLSKAKIGLLFQKLMNYSNEEKALNEVVENFLRHDSEFVAKAVLGRIALDVHDKPDAKCYPAPLMTPTQRVMLGFMLRLEKLGMEMICSDFLKLAEQKVLQTIELSQMLPIANLYLAVCKFKKDIHRMRNLCCEVAYFCDNLVVPFLFLVLGSWSDVLPHHNDIAKNPIAKVLVQIIYMKNCVELPGYNLMALRDLLIKFYGYPTERWDSDELFLELYNDYLKKPDRTTDLPLLLLCKNHPDEWVSRKIDEYFKPLVCKVPTENSKATVIILIGHLSSCFSNKDKIEEWMESLMEDTTSDVVQRSIDFCLDKFQNN